MYCLDIQAELKKPLNNTLDTARLLRSIGATGRHTGYNYLIYIVDLVRADPDNNCFLTKCIYPQTAKHFNVKPASVEHAIRTLISSCWNRDDHTALDYVAGTHLERIPTNGQFIDMLVAFLDYINA